MSLTRRDFLKLMPIAAAPLVVPVGLLPEAEAVQEIVFVDVTFDDAAFRKAMTLGETRMMDGRPGVTVTMDTRLMWQAARLTDSEGRRWTTDGETLRHGDWVIPFPVEGTA